MPQNVRISLDAMGGDHAPSVVVGGAALALAQHPNSSFVLFGDEANQANASYNQADVLLQLGRFAEAEPLLAQGAPYAPAQQVPPVARTVSLAGPRFGFTFLDDGVVAKLKTEDIEVKNGISQFGWQFERQFYSKEGGPSVLNE